MKIVIFNMLFGICREPSGLSVETEAVSHPPRYD